MAIHLTNNEFDLIRDFIENKCAISINKNKKYLIENRLSKIVTTTGCKTFGEFHQKLKYMSKTENILEKVIDAITTNETLWFRDQHPYNIFTESILPKFVAELKDKKRSKISIWSAACSTGQEPYSIAMTIHDYFKNIEYFMSSSDSINIVATDISNSALSKAIKGQYDEIAMNRGMPKHYLENYFNDKNTGWCVKKNIKDMVKFKQFNLMDPFLGIFDSFDVIFLRNVIIYFADHFKKELLTKIAKAMKPGGYLFLGSSETANTYTKMFDAINSKYGSYYQLNDKK